MLFSGVTSDDMGFFYNFQFFLYVVLDQQMDLQYMGSKRWIGWKLADLMTNCHDTATSAHWGPCIFCSKNYCWSEVGKICVEVAIIQPSLSFVDGGPFWSLSCFGAAPILFNRRINSLAVRTRRDRFVVGVFISYDVFNFWSCSSCNLERHNIRWLNLFQKNV